MLRMNLVKCLEIKFNWFLLTFTHINDNLIAVLLSLEVRRLNFEH